MNPKNHSHVIAAYLRLSQADGDLDSKTESNSISNQRKLIEHYLLSHPDLSDMEYTEYIDDGYTGVNTARPSLQMMLHKVRSGEIQCIIVKDMSRLSRDYLTLGDYVEQFFPMQGVRFIAINDGYDSKEQSAYLQSMSIALQGLFYDYYSKDLSRKRSLSNIERMKNGFLPPNAPFGYRTDRKKQQYEPDPEAAVIVRLIFDLVLAEYNLTEIVNLLNDSHIPTPNTYNKRHPELRKPVIPSTKPQPVWRKLQISRIIHNPVYKGTLIMHKSYTSLSEHKRNCSVPQEQQIVRDNAHTPIISNEDFEKAGQLVRLRPNWKSPWVNGRSQTIDYVLVGTLRCGHCGFYMFYIKEKLGVRCTNHYLKHTNCTNDIYSLPVLEDYVFYELRAIFQQILLEKVQQEEAVRQARRQLKDCQRQILTLKRQLESAIQDKRKLFEAFSSGDITQTNFSSRKEALTLFSDEIQTKIANQEKEEDALFSVTVNPEILVLAEKAEYYLSEGALTRDMVTDYVKEVKIYGADDYRITWKYPELFEEMRKKAKKDSGKRNLSAIRTPITVQH